MGRPLCRQLREPPLGICVLFQACVFSQGEFCHLSPQGDHLKPAVTDGPGSDRPKPVFSTDAMGGFFLFEYLTPG